MSDGPGSHDLDGGLKVLIRRKAKRVFRRDQQELEDAEQELIVRFLAKLRDASACAAYPRRTLKQIACNILREARAQKRRAGRQVSLHGRVRGPLGAITGLGDLLADDRRRPRSAADADWDMDLHEALALLPNDLRHVTELLREGMSVADIAVDLCVSRSTIYRRLSRVVEGLREKFFEES